MKINTVAHVCIKTGDLKKTAEFYCDVLGMSRLFNFTREGNVIGFYLKTSGHSFIEVFLASGVEAEQGRKCLNHFCLETDDAHGLRQKLEDRGYAPGEVKTGGDNSLQFWIADPNGLAIEFQQYTEHSSQTTGRDVEVNS